MENEINIQGIPHGARELNLEEIDLVNGGDSRWQTGEAALAGAAYVASSVGGAGIAVGAAPFIAVGAIVGLVGYGSYSLASYAFF